VDRGERAELSRLLSRLADGDRAAFDPAFALLWPLLRAFAEKLAGPDGEDAAQGALLAVFSRAAEFDPERDPVAWALGIATWECRALLRKRGRRREEPLHDLDRVDAAASPEVLAIDRQLRQAVFEIAGALRPTDAEALLALATDSRPPDATFRKRLSRALGRFRLAWRARHGSD
jgi:RNA polymerase sigma-70 factor (ECF subfamily)